MDADLDVSENASPSRGALEGNGSENDDLLYEEGDPAEEGASYSREDVEALLGGGAEDEDLDDAEYRSEPNKKPAVEEEEDSPENEGQEEAPGGTHSDDAEPAPSDDAAPGGSGDKAPPGSKKGMVQTTYVYVKDKDPHQLARGGHGIPRGPGRFFHPGMMRPPHPHFMMGGGRPGLHGGGPYGMMGPMLRPPFPPQRGYAFPHRGGGPLHMGPRGHPRMMMMMMPMMPRYDGIDGMITPGDEEGDDDGDDVDAEGNPDDAGGDDGSKPKPLMSIKMSAGVKAEFEAKVRSSESGRIAPLGMGMGPKFHPFLRHEGPPDLQLLDPMAPVKIQHPRSASVTSKGVVSAGGVPSRLPLKRPLVRGDADLGVRPRSAATNCRSMPANHASDRNAATMMDTGEPPAKQQLTTIVRSNLRQIQTVDSDEPPSSTPAAPLQRVQSSNGRSASSSSVSNSQSASSSQGGSSFRISHKPAPTLTTLVGGDSGGASGSRNEADRQQTHRSHIQHRSSSNSDRFASSSRSLSSSSAPLRSQPPPSAPAARQTTYSNRSSSHYPQPQTQPHQLQDHHRTAYHRQPPQQHQQHQQPQYHHQHQQIHAPVYGSASSTVDPRHHHLHHPFQPHGVATATSAVAATSYPGYSHLPAPSSGYHHENAATYHHHQPPPHQPLSHAQPPQHQQANSSYYYPHSSTSYPMPIPASNASGHGQKATGHSTKVMMTGLPHGTSFSRISSMTTVCGNVRTINVRSESNSAIVEFEHPASVDAFIGRYHKSTLDYSVINVYRCM